MKRVDTMNKIAFLCTLSTLVACSRGVASEPFLATLRGKGDTHTIQLDRISSTSEGRGLHAKQAKNVITDTEEVSVSMSSMLCMSLSSSVVPLGIAEFVYISAEDVPIEDVHIMTSHGPTAAKSSKVAKSNKSPSEVAKSNKSPATATTSPVGPIPAAKSSKIAKSNKSPATATTSPATATTSPVGPIPAAKSAKVKSSKSQATETSSPAGIPIEG